jgi:hypothetical protein
MMSCGGSLSIATVYWLDDPEELELESQQGQEFSLLHIVQTSSGVHPSSSPMGTGGSFPWGKAAGADLYIHYPLSLQAVVLI